MNTRIEHFYEFSYLIVNYNGGDSGLLESCIKSIFEYCKTPSQIIIVDNGSTDSSAEVVNNFKSAPHDVIYIPLQNNYGPSYARSVAMPHLQGRITVVLDNDAELTENSLNGIIDLYSKHERLAIIQPLLIVKSSGLVDYGGDFISKTGFLLQNVEPLTLPDTIDDQKKNCLILSAKSAGMFISTNALRSVGGFDPWFYIYVEETDLGFKCWNHGYYNLAKLDNVVLHNYGSSSKSLGAEKVNINSAYYGSRNYLAMIYLNVYTRLLYSMLPLNIIGWILFSIYCLLKGETIRSKYYILGVFAFFKSLKHLSKQRIARMQSSIDQSEIFKIILKGYQPTDLLRKLTRRPVIGNSGEWR